MSLTYVSLCDGIGAVHVAWQPLGWRCQWVSEINGYADAVVKHHWNLPNLGDMTKITEENTDGYGDIDIVVGGPPCVAYPEVIVIPKFKRILRTCWDFGQKHRNNKIASAGVCIVCLLIVDK